MGVWSMNMSTLTTLTTRGRQSVGRQYRLSIDRQCRPMYLSTVGRHGCRYSVGGIAVICRWHSGHMYYKTTFAAFFLCWKDVYTFHFKCNVRNLCISSLEILNKLLTERILINTQFPSGCAMPRASLLLSFRRRYFSAAQSNRRKIRLFSQANLYCEQKKPLVARSTTNAFVI